MANNRTDEIRSGRQVQHDSNGYMLTPMARGLCKLYGRSEEAFLHMTVRDSSGRDTPVTELPEYVQKDSRAHMSG